MHYNALLSRADTFEDTRCTLARDDTVI